MSKRIFIAGAAAVLTVGIVSVAIARTAQFVPYVPLLAEGSDQAFVEHPEMLSADFTTSFIAVAGSYGHEVRIDSNGQPLIRRSLRDSREMLWNLTSKAELSMRSTRAKAETKQ